MKQVIHLEILPDGRYAITKDDWEEFEKAQKEFVKESFRQGMTQAAYICDELSKVYGTHDDRQWGYEHAKTVILTERDKETQKKVD